MPSETKFFDEFYVDPYTPEQRREIKKALLPLMLTPMEKLNEFSKNKGESNEPR